MLQPRSATELVDAAVQLMRRHFRPLVVLAVVIAIPSLLLGIVARLVQPDTPTVMADLAASGTLLGVMALASVCVASVGFGALVSASAAAYEHGRALEPMEALRRALRRTLAIIVGNVLATIFVVLMLTAVLFGVAVVIGLVATAVQLSGRGGALTTASQTIGMLLGIGSALAALLVALLFGARYALVTAAAVLETRGPLSSLRRSRELVRGHLWHTAAVVGIGIVFYLVTYFTALALSALLLRDLELASTASSVVVVIVYPFVGCLMTVLYFDLRIRREGYDVEQMARALDEPEAAGAAGAADPAASASAPVGGASLTGRDS
ncbi:MAG: hypothetical protein ACYC2G_10075 [Gemmatimonadaceae bacterium]